jgi:hypothetical protein
LLISCGECHSKEKGEKMPTLNLVLHGLFTIVEEPNRVVLAVPFVKDHVYYETAVLYQGSPRHYGRGSYELLGVTAGNSKPTVPPEQSARIGSGSANCTEVLTTAPPAYATFTLPQPKKVYACECFKFGTDVVFIGKHAKEIRAKEFARIIVFAYDFVDIRKIRFTGLPGFTACVPVGKDDCPAPEYVNAAIIAAGKHPEDDGSVAPSVTASFNEMIRALTPSKDIQLFPVNEQANPSNDCKIPGLGLAELEKLIPPSRSDFGITDCISLVVNNG